MKALKRLYFMGFISLIAPLVHGQNAYFFNEPASNSNEAIPVGNGRLGGVVFGGVSQEVIQTNDDTFWAGENRLLQNKEANKFLPEIRSMIYHGKHVESQALINKHLLGANNQSYLPFADVCIDFPHSLRETSLYRRSLDLDKGIVTVAYESRGVRFLREVFASYPDQSIIMRLSADHKGSINCVVSLKSLIRHKILVDPSAKRLDIMLQAPAHVEPNYEGVHPPIYKDGVGMRAMGTLQIRHKGGVLSSTDSTLILSNADEAELIFVAATSFNGFDKNPNAQGLDERAIVDQYRKNVLSKRYSALLKRHIKDYQSLYQRVFIDLGTDSKSHLPLNERLRYYRPDSDPALTALYFQFGRYLLISSSRPASQPANLQGIWNPHMQPGWSSNWTINCNAQINYWPVETTNLSECHEPLIRMTREASIDGARTAKDLYNARGWVAHHNLDIWRTTWPVGGSGLWAIFQVGGAWLCQHVWDHYQFTLDKKFLDDHFDLLKGASLFYVDNLQRDREGYLVTNPSESFENSYRDQNGKVGWACMGSAQDMQIVRALMKSTLQAAKILDRKDTEISEISKAYSQLAPMKISPRTGELQEWNDDWDPANFGSGQLGHGWGLVVSDLITRRHTPELAHAFRKTIEKRRPQVAYNSGSWTGAFPANFFARLGEGDSAQVVIDRHLKLAMYPNMTCSFVGFWEIDGNLGITAAIAEMLLQSHAGEIELLPALPSKYPVGSVKGLCARGGFVIDIEWDKGVLIRSEIYAKNGGEILIRYRDSVKLFKFRKGERLVITPKELCF